MWRRAGMDGTIVGLAVAEALAGMAGDIDQDLARWLLVIAETRYVAKLVEKGDRDGGRS